MTGTMTGRFIALTMETVWHTATTPTVVVRTPLRTLTATQRSVTPSSDVLKTSLAFPKRSITTPCDILSIPLHTASRRMTTTVEGGELSVATLDDYEQVVNLCSNVYHGLDYLPYIFPHLVQGPGVKGFLYKVEGELASFHSRVILNREQTVLWMGIRVKESLQGRGILTQTWNLSKNHHSDCSLYPHLRQQMVVTQYGNLQTKGYSLLLTTHTSAWEFDASILSKLTMKPSQGQVTSLHPEEMAQLLDSPPSCWSQLFPHQHFVVAERPYAIMADNLPAIWNSGFNTQFYGTKIEEGRYSLLSAGSYHLCHLGVCYYLDIFGTVRRHRVDVSNDERKTQTDVFETTRRKEDTITKSTEAAVTDIQESKAGKDAEIFVRPQTLEVKEKRDIFHAAADIQKSGARKNVEVFMRTQTQNDKEKKTVFHIDQAVNAQGTYKPQVVKEHIITHLHRLQQVSSPVTSKVIFNVFASDVLDDVIEDVTQDLKACKLVLDDDVCMVWAKDFKGHYP